MSIRICLDHIGLFLLEFNEKFLSLMHTFRMSPVRILVMYNGDWIFSENGFEFNGDKLKGIVVDEKITYTDLLDRVYDIVKVDRAEFVATMKCLYKAHVPTPPTEILDNEDVDFFIGENLVDDHGRRTPLCITIKRRESLNQGKEVHYPAPFDSGSVSNQTSGFVPTAQDSQFPPFLALTETEEQNTTAISCGPQEDLNCDDEMQNVVQHQHEDCNDNRERDNEVENVHMQNDTYGCSDEIHPHTSSNMSFDSLTVRNGRKSIQVYETPDPLNSSIQPCIYSEQLNVNVPKNLTIEQWTSNDTIAVGQSYPSKKDVQSKLSLMAIRENFEFKVRRSTRDLLFVICVDKGCKWRVRASKMNDSDCFLIRKFHNVHTCSTEKFHRNHHQASSWVVGQLIKSKFEEGASDYRPNDIIKDVEKQLGVTISYDKAWRAREIALRCLKISYDREKRSRGRPRKEKLVSTDKEPSLRLCGTCGGRGHNRKTCRSLIVLQ